MYKNCPLNLRKRFIFFGEIPLPIEDIANSVTRTALKSIPQDLGDILHKAQLIDRSQQTTYRDRMSQQIRNKGIEAAKNAIRSLGPRATEAQARAAAQDAVRQIAQAEMQTARTAAQQVITQHAQKLAAETAAREATKRTAANQATQQSSRALARVAAQQGTNAIVRVGAQRAAVTVAAEAVTASVAKGAVAGGASLALPIAAAVAGVGLAGWQGYGLYRDVERGGWVTRGEVQEGVARSNEARYDVQMIQKEYEEAEKVMNDRLRGVALVARNCSSDIISDMRTYGKIAGDDRRLNNQITYGKTALNQLITVMTPADANSQTYKEAEKSKAALESALDLARNVQKNNRRPVLNDELLSKAVEAKNIALLEKNKTNDLITIDKKIETLATIENNEKTSIIAKLNQLKTDITKIENAEDYKKLATKYNDVISAANDLILSKETKLTPENIAAIVRLYLATKIENPELKANNEFVNRMMGLAAGLASPNMNVEEFDAAMRSAFNKNEFTPDNMVPMSEYFKQVMEKNGKPAIKGAEWNVWDPFTVSYLVGLAHKAKNHPALGSSADAYIEEIQKMLNDKEWQNSMPEAAKYGGDDFYYFINSSLANRNLSSPEQFFNYQEKPADATDASKTPRTVSATGGTGGPRPQPGKRPLTPEQLDDREDAVKSCARGPMAFYVSGFRTLEMIKSEGVTNADDLGQKVLGQINDSLNESKYTELAGKTVSIGQLVIVIDGAGNASLKNPEFLQTWSATVWKNKEKNEATKPPEADKETPETKDSPEKTAARKKVQSVLKDIIKKVKNMGHTGDPAIIVARLKDEADGRQGEINTQDRAALGTATISGVSKKLLDGYAFSVTYSSSTGKFAAGYRKLT